MKYAGIRDVIDVRGTDEGLRRIVYMRPYLPESMLTLPAEAFP